MPSVATRPSSGPHQLVAAARDLRSVITTNAPDGERLRRLPDATVTALRHAGIFSMLIPQAFGGQEVDIHTAMDVIEEIAAADGSAGWCVVKGAPSNMMAAYLAPDAAKEIWSDPSIVTGGSFSPMGGRATEVDGGYRLTGRWDWGTGVPHCSWMVCGATVMDGDRPLAMPNGMPLAKAFFVPKADVAIIDTWDAHGMRATGSHDFAVSDVFVPARFAFDGLSAMPVTMGPLYAVPYITQFALPHGILAVGIARAAVEFLVELSTGKVPLMSMKSLREREVVQHGVGEADATVRAARHYLHGAAAGLWSHALTGSLPTPELARDAHMAAVHATQTCLRAVDAMYLAAGGSAVPMSSPLQRAWRDIHVAAAHFLINDDKYTQSGKYIVGLPHGLPPVLAAQAMADFAGTGGNVTQH
jgi:indole-3-acetate monooxygenase